MISCEFGVKNSSQRTFGCCFFDGLLQFLSLLYLHKVWFTQSSLTDSGVVSGPKTIILAEESIDRNLQTALKTVHKDENGDR